MLGPNSHRAKLGGVDLVSSSSAWEIDRRPLRVHVGDAVGLPCVPRALRPTRLQMNAVCAQGSAGLFASSMTPSRLVAMLLGLLLALLALQAAEAAEEAQTQATPHPPQPTRQRRPLHGARRRVKPVSTTS